ncbi:DUF4400 domain-containing protein [Halioxenophilus sp. WMMB6]|uniref:DUF4400 domain-containing protein n=1 Tax=Halioxenophilus sp. WMMB6 TaxID=3073815 RepID=UPI00398BEE87
MSRVTPVFGLFTLIALVDGPVYSNLHRWGGGWKSSFVYLYAKKSRDPTDHYC